MTRTDLATLADAQGIPAGTSFPGSPSSNDLFYRTDRDLLYFYDGTQWLTVNLFEAQLFQEQLAGQSATGTAGYWAVDSTYGMYLVDVCCSLFVNGTNSGTSFWTLAIARGNSANSYTDIATADTSADAGSTWLRKTLAINAVLDSTARVLRWRPVKTSTPGNLHAPATLRYRLIG